MKLAIQNVSQHKYIYSSSSIVIEERFSYLFDWLNKTAKPTHPPKSLFWVPFNNSSAVESSGCHLHCYRPLGQATVWLGGLPSAIRMALINSWPFAKGEELVGGELCLAWLGYSTAHLAGWSYHYT